MANGATGLEAFSNHYNKLAPAIYTIALRLSGNEAIAGQILTDTFKCLQESGRLNGIEQITITVALRYMFPCIKQSLQMHLGPDALRENFAREVRLLHASYA